MATALFSEHFQVGSSSGQPVAGALLYFYSPGTTTPITTYADSGLITPSTTVMQTDGSSAIVADNTGTFAPIYVTTSPFKFVLKTAGLITIQTVDPAYVSVSSGGTTQVLFGDGTVLLPGIAFTNDPNTGIYRIGADDIGISAGGAKIAEFSSTGALFQDNLFTVFDNSDPTRQAVFEASGITSGTKRTYTLPDANGTLALRTDLITNSGFRNRLINGNGIINQRVYTTVADDTYWCDHHYVLTQTNTITPTIVSNVQNGLPSMMRLTQSQASSQRMGNAQIIESINCRDMRGATITLFGKLRSSSAQAIRYAILEWTGTADSVTSDVVNDWTSASFTAGNFFVSTTTNLLATGSATPVANAVTNFLLTGIVGSSANNLIVMIWTEAVAAQNLTLDVAWELQAGDLTGQVYPLEMRAIAQEMTLSQRYFQRFGNYVTAENICGISAGSTTVGRGTIHLLVQLRSAPSISAVNQTSFKLDDGNGTNITTTAAGGFGGPSINTIPVSVTVASGLTAGKSYQMECTGTPGGMITADAEL